MKNSWNRLHILYTCKKDSCPQLQTPFICGSRRLGGASHSFPLNHWPSDSLLAWANPWRRWGGSWVWTYTSRPIQKDDSSEEAQGKVLKAMEAGVPQWTERAPQTPQGHHRSQHHHQGGWSSHHLWWESPQRPLETRTSNRTNPQCWWGSEGCQSEGANEHRKVNYSQKTNPAPLPSGGERRRAEGGGFTRLTWGDATATACSTAPRRPRRSTDVNPTYQTSSQEDQREMQKTGWTKSCLAKARGGVCGLFPCYVGNPK